MEFQPEGYTYGKVARYREMMMLHWLCEQFAARYDHLEALTGRTNSTVAHIVDELRDLGYVEKHRLMVGERIWVFPTGKGMRACGLTYNALKPRAMSLAHIAATNDVRLYIQQRSEETRWISERQLMVERSQGGHVPDGLAISDGLQVAIEVELSQKKARYVKAKLDVVHERFDVVLYFCAPGPYRQLNELAQSGRWPKLGVRELPRAKAVAES